MERTAVSLRGSIQPNPDEALPEGAVRLNHSSAALFRTAEIKSWGLRSEFWPITAGPMLGQVTVLISSFVMHVHSQQMFLVYRWSYFGMTLFPLVTVLPFVYDALVKHFVYKPVLSATPNRFGSLNHCHLCYGMRLSLIQATCGLLIPGAFSFAAWSVAAVAERAYPMPEVTNVKSLWHSIKIFSRGLRLSGPVMLLGHTTFGFVLAYHLIEANLKALVRNANITSSSSLDDD